MRPLLLLLLAALALWYSGWSWPVIGGLVGAGLVATLLVARGTPPDSPRRVEPALVVLVVGFILYSFEPAYLGMTTFAGGGMLGGVLLGCIPGARSRRAHLYLARTALVLISSLIALLIAEWAVRTWQAKDMYRIPAVEGSAAEEVMVRGDLLKWGYAPHFKGTFAHPEYNGESFETNSYGYRDLEWPDPLPEGELRVLTLGDSLTVGLGVERRENYPSRIAAHLSESLGRPVRVFNAAVAGYGPGEQLIVLQGLRDRLRPDLVIALFYDGNDFEDIRWQYRRERLKGRFLVPMPTDDAAREGRETGTTLAVGRGLDPRPPLWSSSYWESRSHAMRLVFQRLKQLRARLGSADSGAVYTMTLLRSMRLGVEDAEIEEDLLLTRVAYQAMKLLCDGGGAKLLVARIPTKTQSSPGEFSTLMKDLGLDESQFDRALPGRAVIESCNDLGIAAVDLLPVLEVRGDTSALEHFFGEGHPNRLGHVRVAEAVAEAARALLDEGR